MKKYLMIILLSLAGLSLCAQEKGYSSSLEDAVSLHSFSLQIGGLDYSYEQRLGGDFSMVFRVGLLPEELAVYSDPWGSQSFAFTSALGLVIEPRFYTNFNRRSRLGKTTYKNSADFVALKLAGAYSGECRIGITPMYGIRRVWSKHWFGEFTTGVNINVSEGINAGLHLQYRIGFVF